MHYMVIKSPDRYSNNIKQVITRFAIAFRYKYLNIWLSVEKRWLEVKSMNIIHRIFINSQCPFTSPLRQIYNYKYE
jgi:hypothetical protein